MQQDHNGPSGESLTEIENNIQSVHKPKVEHLMQQIRGIANGSKSELSLIHLILDFERNHSGGVSCNVEDDLGINALNIDIVERTAQVRASIQNLEHYAKLTISYPWILVLPDFFLECSDLLDVLDLEGDISDNSDWNDFLKLMRAANNDERLHSLEDTRSRWFEEFYRNIRENGILSVVADSVAGNLTKRNSALLNAIAEIPGLDIRQLKKSLDAQHQFLGELMTLLRQKISYES